MFSTVRCLVLPMCILTSCSSVLCVLMVLGMFMFVKVMSSKMLQLLVEDAKRVRDKFLTVTTALGNSHF